MSSRDNYNNGRYYDDGYGRGQGYMDDLDAEYDRRYGDDYDAYDAYDEDFDDYEDRPAPRSRKKTSSHKSTRGNGRSSSNKRSSNRRRKKKKSNALPVIMIILMILVLSGAFGAKLFLDKYSYSKERYDLAGTDYFDIQGENDVPIIWGTALSEVRAKLIDGGYYIAFDAVKKNLNDGFYYGKQNSEDTTGMILYALPTQLVRTDIGSTEVKVGEESQTKDYVPAVRDGDTIYLNLEFVKEYTNFSYQAFTEPNRLQIHSSWEPVDVATVQKATATRNSGGIKSPIIEDLEKGEQVTIIERMENWSKVLSDDALIGWVENKRLSEVTTSNPTPVTDYVEPEYASKQLDGKVNLAFHNVWGSQGNDTLSSYMAPTKSVNVVAPTWYWVNDNNGNMDKAATQSYVDTAHAMGVQVWAVVDNFNSQNLPDHSIFLSSLDSRTNLINQLLEEQKTYGFDGINVDFEQVDVSYGPDYVQFIRELSIACRNNGIILSVDDYPSYDFNSFYDIKEQGVFADYVVMMGYDEHYAGSTEAGSVASIDYVTNAIKMALDDGVPANKLINAVPFYDRLWWTENGVVRSEAHGMQETQDFLNAHGMVAEWNAAAGQNYAETTEGDTLIQVWVEDAKSIEAKLDVMHGFGIAGVGSWRLQFETPDVWDVIAAYMNK